MIMRKIGLRTVLALACLFAVACESVAPSPSTGIDSQATAPGSTAVETLGEGTEGGRDVVPAQSDPYAAQREDLVQRTIVNRGVSDPAVLSAMRAVPRHLFVPDDLDDRAYDDRPLPIG